MEGTCYCYVGKCYYYFTFYHAIVKSHGFIYKSPFVTTHVFHHGLHIQIINHMI